MGRVAVVLLGLVVLVLTGAYFWTGKPGYLKWAKGLFMLGLSVGLVFFLVLLVMRLV